MTRAAQNALTNASRHLLYPLLLDEQLGACAACGKEEEKMEIDHLRYGEDVRLVDLQLLCRPCHAEKTDNDNDRHQSRFPHCSTCECYG